MGIKLKGVKKIGLGKISAVISADVYNPVNERQEKIQNYIYLKEYSTPEISVYMDHPNKSIIIGSRGTSNLKDVGTDLLLVAGKLDKTKRLKELNNLIERLKNRWPDHHITTTGHSLGGSLSRESGSDLSHSFNEGAGIDQLFKKKDKQQISHRIEYDPVSLINASKADETLEKDSRYNSHTIKQFADLQTN